MCGIIGYIGDQEAWPIIINGLKRLEYRGYDSAGLAVFADNKITEIKTKGRVYQLEELVQNENPVSNIGMGHTRWATHGEPNDINAHPHSSMHGKFSLIHNGIIENYTVIKDNLIKNGYTFKSDTDSEVLVNLIEYVYMNGTFTAEEAIRAALSNVVGAYGLVIMCIDEQDKLIVTRKGSPIVLGIGNGEYFVASDATPIAEYTKNVIYLNDDDIAILSKNGLMLKSGNSQLAPQIQKLNLNLENIEKGGFSHFMLKEIYEQVTSINDTIRGRVNTNIHEIILGGIQHVLPQLIGAKRIVIIACGTSWHAALVGKYMIEEFCRIPVEVDYASEYRYRNPIIHQGDILIAISQSGETADTLAAIRLAKAKGAMAIGICNVVGSSISRETDAGIYTHAGVEIGVASTKAFTAQLAVLTMMALLIGRKKGELDVETYNTYIDELFALPQKITSILNQNDDIKQIALDIQDAPDALYLGRGCNFPVALEGALKLKEISYIHAEGYPAAEMKHGPIALITDKMPVMVVAPQDSCYEKNVSNIKAVESRKGKIIAIINKEDVIVREIAYRTIEIPQTLEYLYPLLSVIPFQLLSYHIAVARGCNVDMPRNLAKSVTVE